MSCPFISFRSITGIRSINQPIKQAISGTVRSARSHSIRARSFSLNSISVSEPSSQSDNPIIESQPAASVERSNQPTVTGQSINHFVPQSTDQSIDRLIEHEYSGKGYWTCRQCRQKHQGGRVHCPCGETNKALQNARKQQRQSQPRINQIIPRTFASHEKESKHVNDNARTFSNHVDTMMQVRQQVLERAGNPGVCDWDGCTVPLRLLNILRLDPSLSETRVAGMTSAERLEAVQRHTVDGQVMLRCMCPLHQQMVIKERMMKKYPGFDGARFSQKSFTRWKQQKKIELKHCTHDHCYHPDIAECDLNTMDLFALVNILDNETWRELDIELSLDERAKPLTIHTSAPKTHKRRQIVMPELEKCRLMHLTCARDHRDRQKSMTIEQKKQKLRFELPTLAIADWYRDLIIDGLDRHDAATGETCC